MYGRVCIHKPVLKLADVYNIKSHIRTIIYLVNNTITTPIHQHLQHSRLGYKSSSAQWLPLYLPEIARRFVDISRLSLAALQKRSLNLDQAMDSESDKRHETNLQEQVLPATHWSFCCKSVTSYLRKDLPPQLALHLKLLLPRQRSSGSETRFLQVSPSSHRFQKKSHQCIKCLRDKYTTALFTSSFTLTWMSTQGRL